MNSFGWLMVAAITATTSAQIFLERLNARHVRAHATEVPEAFRNTVDPATYSRSVEYTLAKNRLGQMEILWGAIILLAVLFSGVLPGAFAAIARAWGNSAGAAAAGLFAIMTAMSLPSLPLDWYAQFRLEERFGFNTTTPKTWWLDRLKGLALALVLGYPLLVLMLKLMGWMGTHWWLWAWGLMMGFQLLMMVFAPVLILPLFNKFTPLPEGGLRTRLLALAARTGFHAHSIQVMDGSKRSRHSNAFFTGFGRFRKIVLFDTLIQQLAEVELEAVLAHEIGHYQRRHILKMVAGSAAMLLAAFYTLAWLMQPAWFYEAFGFAPGHLAAALLLFGLLGGTAGFWFSPVTHWWSRRYEYEADAFAAQAMNEPQSLIGALRKLSEKNLSNLTPHPFYSGFYYSHPTLLERERALAGGGR